MRNLLCGWELLGWDVINGDDQACLQFLSDAGVWAAALHLRSAVEHPGFNQASDQALIARVAKGDQLAMRTLFARHQTAVYRWIRRFVRDEASAEDLLSEVFLDVWRQAGSFQARLVGIDVASCDRTPQGALGLPPPRG